MVGKPPDPKVQQGEMTIRALLPKIVARRDAGLGLERKEHAEVARPRDKDNEWARLAETSKGPEERNLLLLLLTTAHT